MYLFEKLMDRLIRKYERLAPRIAVRIARWRQRRDLRQAWKAAQFRRLRWKDKYHDVSTLHREYQSLLLAEVGAHFAYVLSLKPRQRTKRILEYHECIESEVMTTDAPPLDINTIRI
jgi:hypothetical protein